MSRVTAVAWLLLACSPARTQPISSEQAEFFEKKIRPVLAEHCYKCHGSAKQSGDIRLDARAHLLKERPDGGPIVVLGEPTKSPLLRALRHQGEIKMPPKTPLPAAVVDDIAAWVKMGAPWPNSAAVADSADAWQKHWAFQPLRKPTVPQNGAAHPIDAFILARLADKGLSLAPSAEPRTLLRRLAFDLHGLPPTIAEMEQFQQSAIRNPQSAIAETVERLLASPHYGERWGRYWLDIARYADTKGYVFTEERRYAYAYTYRDWVVQALNEDMPYDQFLIYQLAADRLVAAKLAEPRQQAAMGYLTLGRRFLNNTHDIIDDRIDVVTRGMLGLTVACARCHDHKYDPIPTKDYYSLYGVFASSTEPKDLPIIAEPERTPDYLAYEKELGAKKQVVADFKSKHKDELDKNNRKFRDELRVLENKVAALQASSKFAPPRAMVLVDLPSPVEPRVLLRGNPGSPGATIPRQFLSALSGPKRVPFKDGSGRLELARAIAAPGNPLTARVLVNRVWLYHFGAPLVRTPSDFGLRSEAPSHPELLDYLAARFIEDGWSLKKLHKLILTSATWQQSSNPQSTIRNPQSADPENRLLWKMNRKRLDFEALRDTLLAVSGKLDRTVGGKAVDITKAPYPPRRTLYGFIDRQNLPGLFRTFDFASPDASSPQRHQTAVPQQALFLLNHPFLHEQARALLALPELANAASTDAKIQQLYRRLYSRAADAEELRLGAAFVGNGMEPLSRLDSWQQLAQVLLLSNELAFVD